MNLENKYWYIKNHKLFEKLSEKEYEQLCIISNMKNATKSDIIYFSEMEVNYIYILKFGTVKICRENSKGKEIISEILTDGDIFGHVNNSTGNKTEYAQVISDDVKLCFFEYKNFIEVLKSNPELSIKYTNTINEKVISFRQKYEDLIFKDVETRVKDFFKRYASYHANKINNVIEMDMMLTHQEIADYIAASRQSVTNIINNLVTDGKIIYEGRRKVIIPNIDLL